MNKPREIFYRIDGQGHPLILCHGYGGNEHDFDSMMDELCKKYTVIRIRSRNTEQSGIVPEFHYVDMAEDVAALIREQNFGKPYFFGVSDGGIVGLILASRYPELLSAMTVCGANTRPGGLRLSERLRFAKSYRKGGSPGLHTILTEPHIPNKALHRICIPVLVMAGTKDMIRTAHTKMIASHIPCSTLKLWDGETHGSYVMDKDLALREMLHFLEQQAQPRSSAAL